MFFYPEEKTAIFVDGPNFYSSAKAQGHTIDFSALRKYFQDETTLVRAAYYSAVNEGEEYVPVRPLLDWLSYNGYLVSSKPMKSYTDPSGAKRNRGDMNIEICVDALELAPRLDHMILCSGNGDFRAMVEAVQRKGVKVSLLCVNQGAFTTVSDDLRRQVDQMVDATSIPDVLKVGRTQEV